MATLNFDVRPRRWRNGVRRITNTRLEAAPRPPSFGAEEVVAERRAVGRLASPGTWNGGFFLKPHVFRLELIDALSELSALVTPVWK